MEKIMDYLLKKMNWEKQDTIDVMYLIDEVRKTISSSESVKRYLENMFDEMNEESINEKSIQFVLKKVNKDSLSSLLKITKFELNYKIENNKFNKEEREKLIFLAKKIMEKNEEDKKAGNEIYVENQDHNS